MAAPRYLEDFEVGEIFETASHRIELGEAIGFAQAHDPQPFHTDELAAKWHPIFRGLSTSGYHTLLVTHKLIFDLDIGHAWGLVGKGIDKLRWKRPVRPGDTLRVVGRVAAISRDPSQQFGSLEVTVTTLNQNEEVVLTMTVNSIVPSRDVLETARAA